MKCAPGPWPEAPTSHAGSRCSALDKSWGAHKTAALRAQPSPVQLRGTHHGVDAQDEAQACCIVAGQDDFCGILLSCFLWRHSETRTGEKYGNVRVT